MSKQPYAWLSLNLKFPTNVASTTERYEIRRVRPKLKLQREFWLSNTAFPVNSSRHGFRMMLPKLTWNYCELIRYQLLRSFIYSWVPVLCYRKSRFTDLASFLFADVVVHICFLCYYIICLYFFVSYCHIWSNLDYSRLSKHWCLPISGHRSMQLLIIHKTLSLFICCMLSQIVRDCTQKWLTLIIWFKVQCTVV